MRAYCLLKVTPRMSLKKKKKCTPCSGLDLKSSIDVLKKKSHASDQGLLDRHYTNSINIKNCENNFNKLLDFLEVMTTVTIGKSWKPVQTGIKITTMSFMAIAILSF